jgi:class 3 adenylate cyclase
VGELEALIGQHPLREELRSQHMLALYRSGRQAEALAGYQTFRRTLADELGLEPSASLRELERRVLQQDPGLEPPGPAPDDDAGAAASAEGSDALEPGREALARHAWPEAYELLARADAAAPLSPADLEGLAAAAWWTCRLDACIAARERAVAAHVAAGEPRRAALVAIALTKDYFAKQAMSIASAWATRAERLLADEPACVEHGHLERLRGLIAFEVAGDVPAALAHAERAFEIALTFGDADLEAVARHDRGRVLVAGGDVAEGMALIDEATVAAIAGELAPYNTGVIYCNTIEACKGLADYRRAGDWTEAAKRWCERQSISGFPGMCRVSRASVMRVRGAWPEAELEARRALDELKEFNQGYAAEAFYELGEVRLRRDDLPAAREAFDRAHELGRDPQPGLALLHLAEGNADAARAGIAQALEEERPLERARLLPALVEVALATGDVEGARAAADELDATADTYGSDTFRAAAGTARARIALAEGDPQLAARSARRALRLWHDVGAPFELAETRMLVASAARAAGDADAALLELRAAAGGFERLGASAHARRARGELDALDAAGAPHGAGETWARTLMLTDIVGSAELIRAIEDEAWADLRAWHDATLRSLFAEHRGEEMHRAGDGFVVAFADPAAAAECAVAIQRRLHDHRRAHGFAPLVRIGLHATPDNPGRAESLHDAARISAHAGGGQIVASAVTLAPLTLRYPTSRAGPMELPGSATPVELVTIDWRP